MDRTTKECNNRSRLEFLENFVLRMRLYLDAGNSIEPTSDTHKELIFMTNRRLERLSKGKEDTREVITISNRMDCPFHIPEAENQNPKCVRNGERCCPTDRFWPEHCIIYRGSGVLIQLETCIRVSEPTEPSLDTNK